MTGQADKLSEKMGRTSCSFKNVSKEYLYNQVFCQS